MARQQAIWVTAVVSSEETGSVTKQSEEVQQKYVQ